MTQRNAAYISAMEDIANQLTQSKFIEWHDGLHGKENRALMSDARQSEYIEEMFQKSGYLAEYSCRSKSSSAGAFEMVADAISLFIEYLPHVQVYTNDEDPGIYDDGSMAEDDEDDEDEENNYEEPFGIIYNSGGLRLPFQDLLGMIRENTEVINPFENHRLCPGMGNEMPFSLCMDMPPYSHLEKTLTPPRMWYEILKLCDDFYLDLRDVDQPRCTMYFKDNEDFLEAHIMLNS